MSYTIITSNTAYPAQVSYQKITLTGDVTLSWPNSLSGGLVAAGFNDIVSSDQDDRVITLPDATLGSIGSDILFANNSLYTINITDYSGNDVSTLIAGDVIDLKLTDTSTPAGIWAEFPFLGGMSAITQVIAESPDNSIIITNGTLLNPGGTIEFKLPASISNISDLNNGVVGISVVKSINPLTWITRTISPGSDNIIITNEDGVDDNPTIDLADDVTVNILQAGDFIINGNTLEAASKGTDLIFSTFEDGVLDLNGVTIDVLGNISGNIASPPVPKAWCTFNDTVFGSSNTIVIEDSSNVVSVTGSGGYYEISFTHDMANINYGVSISVGSIGTTLPPPMYHGFYTTRNTDSVIIAVVDAAGELVTSLPAGVTVMVMSSQPTQI